MHLFSAKDAACSAAALPELAACSLASKLVAMRTVAMISSSVRALLASNSLAICGANLPSRLCITVGITSSRKLHYGPLEIRG